MSPKIHILLLFLFLILFLFLSELKGDDQKSSSAYAFLKQLGGSHKGINVKGLQQLKKYLKHYGYLDYDHHSNLKNNSSDDFFDDLLESAVRKYQTFFKLNVTGKLDSKTVEIMSQPRCGVPDFLKSGNDSYQGRSYSYDSMVSHYTFFPGEPKWPSDKKKLTYSFRLGTRGDAIFAIRKAIRKWETVTPFRFSYTINYLKADVRISFRSGDHGDDEAFDGRGGVLAHAYPPTDGRLHFDADEKWSTNGRRFNTIDIQTVALHELGHVLGLGHSDVYEAVMFPRLGPGEKRDLHEDDIQGIKELYGT